MGNGCESSLAIPGRFETSLSGKLVYHLLPLRRRIILANLRRVFGGVLPEREIARLAQAHYTHLVRSLLELIRDSWRAPAQRTALVRVDNAAACIRAHEQGKGVLVLTGHLGNFELASAGGLGNFPKYRGRFHVLRRPISPAWVERLLTRRFRRAGFGVLPKTGSLERLLDCLAAGDAVVFVLDQYAAGRDGVEVEFFGTPAATFRSLAVLALVTGAPVVPLASWRQPGGRHVLRFEEPLALIRCADMNEAIRRNTRAYNAALERMILRHPEQWYWVHRRWKGRDAGAPGKTVQPERPGWFDRPDPPGGATSRAVE